MTAVLFRPGNIKSTWNMIHLNRNKSNLEFFYHLSKMLPFTPVVIIKLCVWGKLFLGTLDNSPASFLKNKKMVCMFYSFDGTPILCCRNCYINMLSILRPLWDNSIPISCWKNFYVLPNSSSLTCYINNVIHVEKERKFRLYLTSEYFIFENH